MKPVEQLQTIHAGHVLVDDRNMEVVGAFESRSLVRHSPQRQHDIPDVWKNGKLVPESQVRHRLGEDRLVRKVVLRP